MRASAESEKAGTGREGHTRMFLWGKGGGQEVFKSTVLEKGQRQDSKPKRHTLVRILERRKRTWSEQLEPKLGTSWQGIGSDILNGGCVTTFITVLS